MTTTRLKAAVVGVGYLGRFHAQKYASLPDVELVGVFDADPNRAKEIAAELKVPVLASLDEVATKAKAVTVAASTSSHYEICKFLLSRGVHVHVEKPITSTSREAEELVAIAKQKNLKLQVGHVERFNPALQAARSKIGKPLFIECHRLASFKPRGADVNVVLDLMIHDLDMILHLVGSEPVNVAAVGTPVITKAIDIANARIEFASGAVANVTASRVSAQAQRKFRVFQDSQYLSLDFGSGEVRLMCKTGDWKADGPPPITQETWNLDKSDALLEETKAFVSSVQNNTPVQVTGEDGLKALRLAETIVGIIEKRRS